LPGTADGSEATVYMDLVTRVIKISLITLSENIVKKLQDI